MTPEATATIELAPPPARAKTQGTKTAEEWLTPARFVLLLALLVVAAFSGVLLGGRAFIIRDFGLFSYPVANFHRECFWRGEIPLWNPLNNCGLPFLAQWNTLTLYPPSLLYLLLPLQWSLSLFNLAHLFWGGVGMYWLAQRWTNHRMAAALASVVFAFNGLTLNLLMWPCHIAAMSWLPWVIFLAQPAWRLGGRWLAWASLAGALQMLTGAPETILLTWSLLFLLACADWFGKQGPRLKLWLRFFGMVVLVALVCAAQLLPFLELASHSQRDSNFGSADWPMPIWGWANLLVPLFRTFRTPQGVFFQPAQCWTSSYYIGIGTLLLGGIALRRLTDSRVRWLAGLSLLGLVLALGDRGLLFRGLRACIPVLGYFRYSVKYVLVLAVLAPLLAAFGLQALDTGARKLRRFECGFAVTLLVLVAVIAVLGWKFPISEDPVRNLVENALGRAGLFTLFVLLLALWLWAGRAVETPGESEAPRTMAFKSKGAKPRTASLTSPTLLRPLSGCLMLGIVWLDLVTHVPNQNPTVPASVYSRNWAATVRNWSPAPRLGHSRVMLGSVAEATLRVRQLPDLEQNYLLSRLALLADCNLLEDIPQAFGFFSLVPEQAHNATVVPLMQTNRDFPGLLDFMGVTQTTAPGSMHDWAPRPSAMPLVTTGQRAVFVDDATAYDALGQSNLDFRQIVLLPPEAKNSIIATQHVAGNILATEFGNQKVSILAAAPAPSMVVVSQSYYPTWRAYIDGHAAKLWRANYAFQAVEVPAGRHRIELRYQDRAFQAGLLISGAGLLICGTLCVPVSWGRKRFSPAPNKTAGAP
jgi:hypothetical protein